MKLIRTTRTGAYYQMNDGRIGYVTPQYARISVAREGWVNNVGEFKAPTVVATPENSYFYQINKTEKYDYVSKHYNTTHECVRRIPTGGLAKSIALLQDYADRNCTAEAKQARKEQMYVTQIKSLHYYIDNVANPERRQYDTAAFDQGYACGMNEIKNQLSKLLLNT